MIRRILYKIQTLESGGMRSRFETEHLESSNAIFPSQTYQKKTINKALIKKRQIKNGINKSSLLLISIRYLRKKITINFHAN